MALLASDLNNPEYAGATNPDSRLAVRFYSKPMQLERESEAQGRPIFKDFDFVQIFVPGDNTTAIDTFAREDHKQRFPLQWAHYQNKHGGDPKEIGTPLAAWSRLVPAQVEELRALKFYTVESVANAADSQLQRIGMVAGMSPYAFRDAAVRFLTVSKDDSAAADAENRAKLLEEQNKKLMEDMAALRAQVEAMQAPKTKGKPGPKPRGDAHEVNAGTL